MDTALPHEELPVLAQASSRIYVKNCQTPLDPILPFAARMSSWSVDALV